MLYGLLSFLVCFLFSISNNRFQPHLRRRRLSYLVSFEELISLLDTYYFTSSEFINCDSVSNIFCFVCGLSATQQTQTCVSAQMWTISNYFVFLLDLFCRAHLATPSYSQTAQSFLVFHLSLDRTILLLLPLLVLLLLSPLSPMLLLLIVMVSS